MSSAGVALLLRTSLLFTTAHAPAESKSARPRLLTIKEAAAELRLRDSTVRMWMARRQIASVHLGRRVFVPTSEIERPLSEGLSPSTLPSLVLSSFSLKTKKINGQKSKPPY